MSPGFDPDAQPIAVQVPTRAKRDGGIAYSIGTLVADRGQYDEMRETFLKNGFGGRDCEYLFIDNTNSNQADAYRGLDAILNAAKGEYVVLCHQDIRLISDDRDVLDSRLEQLHAIDPKWALAGNAGGVAPNVLAIRITDPHGVDRRVGDFPAKVMSLDENFIIVRREARLGFSADLSGFHFYGADICLQADIRGYHSYVIDFHLRHLSGGNLDSVFLQAETAFQAKWRNALRRRNFQTTCAEFRLKGAL